MAAESYTVAARLNMTSNVPEVLDQLVRGFTEVNRLVKDVQGNLAGLRSDLRALSDGNRGIGTLVRQMQRLSEMKLGGGIMGDMRDLLETTRGLQSAQTEMAQAARETAAAYREMAQASRSIRVPSGGGSGGGSSRGGSRGHRFTHGDLLDAGMGLQMGGSFGFNLASGAFMAQAEVQRQSLLAQADTRVTDVVMAQANSRIAALQKQYPTLTQAEGIKLFRENMGIFGNADEALTALPGTVRLQSLYQLTGVGRGGTGGDETQAANKAGDAMQSFINPQTRQLDVGLYNQFMDFQARSVLAGGGLVDAKSWLTFARNARTAGIGLDPQALAYTQALLELSPGRTGTAINSAFQLFGASTRHLTKQTRGNWQRAGLLDRHGELVDQQLYQRDPYQWVWNDLLPRLQKMGVKDRNGVIKWLTDNGQRATVAGLLADIAIGQTPITNTATKINAQDPNAVDKLMNSDLGKVAQLQAAETNFMVAAGKFLEGPGITLLTDLAKALNAMTDWASQHPTAAKDLVVYGAGISSLSKVIGDAATVVYLGSPIVKGFTALGGALLPFGKGGGAAGAIEALAGDGPSSLAKLGGSLLGLAALAGTAVWAIGKFGPEFKRWLGLPGTRDEQRAYDQAHPSPHGNRFMDSLSDWWNQFYNAPGHTGNANTARGHNQATSGAYHPTAWTVPGSQPMVIPISLTMNERKIGEAVMKIITHGGLLPPSGQTPFDPRMSPMPTGATVPV